MGDFWPYAVATICQRLQPKDPTMLRRTKLAIAAIAVATTALVGVGVGAPQVASATTGHNWCC